jgi:hypothetical protein
VEGGEAEGGEAEGSTRRRVRQRQRRVLVRRELGKLAVWLRKLVVRRAPQSRASWRQSWHAKSARVGIIKWCAVGVTKSHKVVSQVSWHYQVGCAKSRVGITKSAHIGQVGVFVVRLRS